MLRLSAYSPTRVLLCATSVLVLGAPALMGPSMSFLLAASAVVAVVAAQLTKPVGRFTPAMAAAAAMAGSVLTDFLYRGDQGLTLVWMPFEYAGLLVLTGRLIRRRGTDVLVWGFAAGIAATSLPLRFTPRNPPSTTRDTFTVLVLALLPVLGAVAVGRYLRASDSRRQAVRRAREEQRAYLARILHDHVAHELTGMVMEVRAARAAPYEADQYDEFLARLEDSGLRALDHMDGALRTLRASDEREADGAATEQPATRTRGLSGLPELVERFAGSTRRPVALDLPADLEGTLSPAGEEAAYDLVLEALTNIRRHAPGATRVSVVLTRAQEHVRVGIDNTADGGHAPLTRGRKGGGTGLVGLAERFALLDGELSSGPTAEGWHVEGRLPLAGPPGARTAPDRGATGS
ncbi:sensor histidine kinase [Streptomyces sp. SPB074]|uniref:sensor histidine kinase n=1 Tax=Streptomyces sp. (strain SPB074) TaxID=465543 RepID=UPI00017FE7C8|nr:histidine kinase [Streptomyces sp. SPB074]EDY42513.1 conserved hypothetical protein [Streptomyces sp. SPB074]